MRGARPAPARHRIPAVCEPRYSRASAWTLSAFTVNATGERDESTMSEPSAAVERGVAGNAGKVMVERPLRQ